MAIANGLLAELEHEAALTRKTLERVPDDKLDYKPHDKSFSMGELSGHIANVPQWGPTTIHMDVFDLPDDYFATYRDRIADVSAADVHRVARDAVRPDRLAIVIVGDADQVRGPVEDLGLGPVEVHETLP